MIYITGDCHGDYRKFSKRQRMKYHFDLGEDDYVIVCGDMGLIWDKKDKTLDYNIDWFSRLPFTILFVDGNHEGFTLLNEYPAEEWNGGKVHHIVKDKVIHLMRGQVFDIEDKKIFTFGGASSHDIQGGILDKTSPDYEKLKKKALDMGLPYRILNESWWPEELPTEKEMQEGRNNLEKTGWKVDYVISHCCASSIQEKVNTFFHRSKKTDVLTDYFDEIEKKLKYRKWYFGHYHLNREVDKKHTVVYEEMRVI